MNIRDGTFIHDSIPFSSLVLTDPIKTFSCTLTFQLPHVSPSVKLTNRAYQAVKQLFVEVKYGHFRTNWLFNRDCFQFKNKIPLKPMVNDSYKCL